MMLSEDFIAQPHVNHQTKTLQVNPCIIDTLNCPSSSLQPNLFVKRISYLLQVLIIQIISFIQAGLA